VQLYIDGEKSGVAYVSPYDLLDGEENVSLSTWWPHDTNDYVVKIVIDDYDSIDESNEENNVW